MEQRRLLAGGIRQYLDEPEKLFRRIRTPEGKLVSLKAARAYIPARSLKE
jgi:hypothetical protein